MKTVDSQALAIVNRALGLSGAGASLTEFLDGSVDQTLDIGELVRRGRTIAKSQGIFMGLLRNIHAGSGTLTSSFPPYTGGTGAILPWPSPMPLGFDVWVIGAFVRQLSGSGTFTGSLIIDPNTTNLGWGVDDGGAAVSAAARIPLAFWDSVVTQTDEIALMEDGQPWAKIGMRLFRLNRNDVRLMFSSTASALATFDCFIMLGVFPVGLGQDVQV